jgi:hypothetical protein
MMLSTLAITLSLAMNAPDPGDVGAHTASAGEVHTDQAQPKLDLSFLSGKVWSAFGVNFCLGEPKTNVHCHLKYRLLDPRPAPQESTLALRFSLFGEDVCLGAVARPGTCAFYLPFKLPTEHEAARVGA